MVSDAVEPEPGCRRIMPVVELVDVPVTAGTSWPGVRVAPYMLVLVLVQGFDVLVPFVPVLYQYPRDISLPELFEAWLSANANDELAARIPMRATTTSSMCVNCNRIFCILCFRYVPFDRPDKVCRLLQRGARIKIAHVRRIKDESGSFS